MVVTAKSNSGLKIGPWIKRGIVSRERCGVYQDYFFTTSKGRMMRSEDLEVDILNRIGRIQYEYSDLIRPGLEVHKEYKLS